MERRVTPIAVIGMGCRLPGGIDSPDAFWQALLRGDDLVTEIPADRWDIEDHYDPERGVRGRSVSRWGGFIDDIGGFDASFFGFGEREATAIDPQHRLLLETSWETVEHAGLAPPALAGSRTGVFVGLCHDDYTVLTSGAGALDEPYGYTGNAFSMASGRISYALGLRGPAITFDTSCSSSLLAVHMAARSLHEGESDLALAGGCMVMLEPAVSASLSAQSMLSASGRSRAFDSAGDGFVRAEGCAVVLLKRLPDALRDSDRILAVVRGTATNQDGRSATITTPSLEAQAEVYQAALDVAGVDAATVGMVEAHGTGTPVGDPLEYGSLARVYGTDGNRCALGSAKTNVGHTESAAGAVGLIKAVLGLRHGVVPPMLHFTGLPDELARIETGLFVPEAVTSWPTNGADGPRRAAVSSFGMSGTNVHAILEQAPEPATQDPASGVVGPLLFPLSASSAEELRRTSQRLAEWVQNRADGLALPDLAYTLARRRGHRPVRTAVIAHDVEELAAGLREIGYGETPYLPAAGHDDRGPVWIFSGQGSQWAAMGAELLAKEPVFAATVAEAEPLIARESGFSVTEAMSAPETVTGIDRVQPTLFTFQVALATAMRAYGVQPGAVIGHSLGEASAAVIAGALSLEDGAKVICRRSRLMSRIAGAGAMASVELPAQQVRAELANRGVTDVVVSVIASPNSTVVGGAAHTVRDLVTAWEQREVMAREVAVDVASHSSQVDPILAELAVQLSDLEPTTPNVTYYSSTLDDPRTRPAFDASYWVDNLRQSVKFAAAVQAALDDGHRVFGEPSPHPLLTRAVEQTAAAADITVAALAGMRREQPLPFGLRGFLTDLYAAGAAVDFSVLYPGGRLVDAPLPTWARQRFLIASDGSGSRPRGEYTVPAHPLLGAHVRLPEEPERHAWQGEIGTFALPWLADHQVNGVAVFPGAGFCEMALASAEAVLGPDAEVRDLRFEQMLMLDENTSVSAVASMVDAGVVDFVVETDREGERTRRAAAVLHTAGEADREPPPRRDIAALLATHPHQTDGATLQQSFGERGIHYGPAFTGLVSARTAEGKGRSVVAEVGLPSGVRSQQAGYGVHPALLDSCFQLVMAHQSVKDAADVGALVPLSVRRLRRYGSTRATRYCHLRVMAESGSTLEVDLDLLDDNGAVLLAVQGLRMGSSGGGNGQPMAQRLLTIDWQQQTLPPVAERSVGAWLLINTTEADLLESGLTDAMKSLGAQSTTLNWPEHADHLANAERLATQVRGGLEGVVIVCPPPAGDPDQPALLQGREQVRHLVRMIRQLPEMSSQPPRLYVVTRRAQVVLPDDRPNLEQGGLRGLLRVIGAENPQLRVSQIDLDDTDAQRDAELVAQELLTGSAEDETAWRGGQWYTARLRCTPLGAHERRTAAVNHESDGMRIEVRNPGDLETLEFVAAGRRPPGPGQIEVAVEATSVNFADVLCAFGRSPVFDGRQPELGNDFAGVVTRVGADVTDHQIGDRVGGFSGYGNGSWGTFVTCDARLVTTLPDSITVEHAAAAAAGYGTAWYGLYDLARLSAEDKVLIHSGTGGVGQAAIAIARLAGAEIFATAGSPQRRALLHEMGIEHVYDSRSTEFAEQIRRDTDGYGVDVVLNSLTGAAQLAGLKLLSFGGRFVEIGKRDIYGDTRVGLFPFRRNLTFYAVDLPLLGESHPQRFNKLVRTVYRHIADGSLPLPNYTEYPLAEAATAIRVMSGAEHTGKLVLSVTRSGESRAVVPPEQAPVFRHDGAYIVTGGLGGLGLFLATEMAKAGCGRIVLTARSNPTPKVRQAIDNIRVATGADVIVECGNIAEADTATRVVAAATDTGLPVRGVLHAAAVVEDATLVNITDELIDRDWAPKVYGAWNLHEATLGQPLDWFCLFSSAAALLGSAGQGAYAAACSWLDAFTHWRRGQGLPASAIAWGAWAEIGRATFLAEGGRTTMITPEEGAHAFAELLRYDRGYTGYVPTTGAPWLTALVARSPFAEAFQAAGEQHGADNATLRAELRSLPQDEWPTRLRRLIAEQTGLILRRPVDPDRPFADHGLDSLGNLELRTRIEAETGIRITPKAIATYNTARALGLHLSETLAAEDAATTV